MAGEVPPLRIRVREVSKPPGKAASHDRTDYQEDLLPCAADKRRGSSCCVTQHEALAFVERLGTATGAAACFPWEKAGHSGPGRAPQAHAKGAAWDRDRDLSGTEDLALRFFLGYKKGPTNLRREVSGRGSGTNLSHRPSTPSEVSGHAEAGRAPVQVLPRTCTGPASPCPWTLRALAYE